MTDADESTVRQAMEIYDQNPIRSTILNASGIDGDGRVTFTARELLNALRGLPEALLDLPVTRYGDEGISGIDAALRYHGEESAGRNYFTLHIALW